MRRMALLACVGAAIATWSSPALAQFRPATGEGLGHAIGSCLAVTEEAGAIGQRLLDRGWNEGTMTPAPEGDAPAFFVSADSEAVIMVTDIADSETDACFVVAKIETIAMFQATTTGLNRVFGEPREQERGEYWWDYDGRIVNFALTGSRDDLGIRFSTFNTAGAD